METNLREKLDISRILIQRIDGLPSHAQVTSLEAANNVLESWADCVPDSGNDQCDFEIVFEDGFRYHGHFYLNKSQKRISLSRHVRKQLTALAAAKAAKAAAKVDGEPPISLIGTDLADSARIALDHYNI